MAAQTERIAALESGIAAILEHLQGATVEDDSTANETPAKGRSSKARKAPGGAGRESRFTPSAVKRLSIPRRKGASFTYHGKRGNTMWKVVAVNDDGSIVGQRTK